MQIAGNSKVSTVALEQICPSKRQVSKRVADVQLIPVDNRISKQAKQPSGPSAQLLSVSTPDLSSEAALSGMSCEGLLQMLNRFNIDVPPRSRKSVLVHALLNHRGASRSRASESKYEHSVASSSKTDTEQTVASSIRVIKADITNMFKEEVKELRSSLINGIKSMKSNNNPIDVDAMPEHDELIQTKAKLDAMLDHKKETKVILQEHLDMFTQVSNIAKEPLMECIKLHSQQMVSLSSNILTQQHQQQQQQYVQQSPAISFSQNNNNGGGLQQMTISPNNSTTYFAQQPQQQTAISSASATNSQFAPSHFGQQQQYSQMMYQPWNQNSMMTVRRLY